MIINEGQVLKIQIYSQEKIGMDLKNAGVILPEGGLPGAASIGK